MQAHGETRIVWRGFKRGFKGVSFSILEKCDCIKYLKLVEPENVIAKKLYASFGFVEAKEFPRGWDEIPAALKL